jgi:hypothetical protein
MGLPYFGARESWVKLTVLIEAIDKAVGS